MSDTSKIRTLPGVATWWESVRDNEELGGGREGEWLAAAKKEVSGHQEPSRTSLPHNFP